MFPWWVRYFIFLPLAALQIILITIKLMGWQYEVGFEQFMIMLGDFVSWALRLEIIEAFIRDVLAGWNIVLPELGKHWHHVFVLTWLLLAATARLAGTGESALTATGIFLLAGLCSFVPAFAVGTMPVGSLAVGVWPAAGIVAFVAIHSLLSGDWRSALNYAALVAAAAAMGYFIGTTGQGTGRLLPLAVAVGVFGLGVLVTALLIAKGTLWQRLQNPSTAAGLDILGPFAAAATAAWLFGKYIPI